MDYLLVHNMLSSLIKVIKPEELAFRVNVSLSTVNRWIAQKSYPQPRQESLIREMYLLHFSGNKTHQQTEDLDRCLIQLREIFHKSSRLSSRNEALEEIAKLFFAHITSIVQNGRGIDSNIISARGKEAESLKNFVKGQIDLYLGNSKQIDSTFELTIKNTENQFAMEIISIFENYYSNKEAIEALKGTDVLNEIFGKFLADSFVDEKQLGQYLTPHEVINFATHMLYSELDLRDVIDENFGLILDPSCGIGSFLTAFINKAYKDSIDLEMPFDINSFIDSKVLGIDKSDRMIKLALINLSMYGCGNINIFSRNALNVKDVDLIENVSVIMTNPPFGAEFPVKELGDFKIISDWSDRNTKKVNSELLFMEKYIDWLKPNGYLVCIVPDSILNNKGIYQTLRNGISSEISIKAVISLPQNTFATAGTETKTSLLFLQKKTYDPKDKTYLAICENIGYDVVTSGTHKMKKYNGKSALIGILNDYQNGESNYGEWISGINDYFRWDATYHASIPCRYIDSAVSMGFVKVKDVAVLSRERFNPNRYESGMIFNYIEISDIDSIQMRAYGKEVRCDEAPSRARKLVHSNNILFSTVRPERGSVAVIDDTQDNYVCTTGFAVLEAQGIDSLALAYLLQSEFVIKQINKYAMGISYPTIDEKDLMEIYLPINAHDIGKYDGISKELKQKEREVINLRKSFKQTISSTIITI